MWNNFTWIFRLTNKKIESQINNLAAEGWQMVFMVIEQKRFWLFWSREAAIVTFGR
jgi:hypothetical protein